MSIGNIKRLVELIVGDLILQANLVPKSTDTYSLGSSTGEAPNETVVLGWKHLCMGDLHMKNDRGAYTIVEEEEYLSVRNMKTGKLYKFVLEEIEESKETPEGSE